jgi:hypothetical protein
MSRSISSRTELLEAFEGDPEKRWNWESQWRSTLEFSTQVYGSLEKRRKLGNDYWGTSIIRARIGSVRSSTSKDEFP